MAPTPLTADEAKDRLDRGDRVVFIDARNATAWGSSDVKLPGAIRVPADAVDEHIDEIPRDASAITYCT